MLIVLIVLLSLLVLPSLVRKLRRRRKRAGMRRSGVLSVGEMKVSYHRFSIVSGSVNEKESQ
jgi:hypothetical protein